MDGEQDGAQGQGRQELEAGASQHEENAQAGEKDPQGLLVGPGDGDGKGVGGDTHGAADYKAALAAKDAEIAELQAKVAEAARSAQAADALNGEIAKLRRQLEDERTDFSLRAAGARSVKAARALLAEHDGDVAALVEAEPWLFERGGGTSQNGSQSNGTGGAAGGGSTGLEPAGASGGKAEGELRRWERIAGLAGDGGSEGDGKRGSGNGE
jgi:hypothetical protein